MRNKSSARKEIFWLFALVLIFGLALGGWVYFSKRWNSSPLMARKIGRAGKNVAFTPDGKQFVAVANKSLIFFDTNSQTERARLASNFPSPFDFDFAPDGTRLATAHTDNNILIWSLPKRTLLHTIKFHDSIPTLAFSPDSKLLASGSWSKKSPENGGKICLWDASSAKLIHQFPDQPSHISDIAFSSDGQTLFTAGGEGKVKAWDVASNQLMREFVAGESLLSVAVSPDGRRVAAGGWKGRIHLWNASTGAPEKDLPVTGTQVRDLNFASDSAQLAVAFSHQTIDIWDVNSRVQTHRFTGLKNQAFSVKFSPDNTLLLSGDERGDIYLWRVE